MIHRTSALLYARAAIERFERARYVDLGDDYDDPPGQIWVRHGEGRATRLGLSLSATDPDLLLCAIRNLRLRVDSIDKDDVILLNIELRHLWDNKGIDIPPELVVEGRFACSLPLIQETHYQLLPWPQVTEEDHVAITVTLR